MRFAFTDDQLALRDAVRDLLDKECGVAQLRAAWTNDSGRVPGLWNSLDAMGVPSMLVAEADGGLGFGPIDAVGVFEEFGRFAIPEPIVDTMALAGVHYDGAPAVVIAPESPLAPWADSCAHVVSLAADGVRVAATSACTLTPRESVDGARRLFEVSVPDGRPAADVAVAARVYRRIVLGTAAQLVGLADRMLELTVGYAAARKQFGVPIGSFQAVKHHLANARIAVEFARPLVYRAAYSLERGDAAANAHASMAKAKASDAAMLTARAALQCHGAIGYTTEYDLHLYMKRAWALAAAWGDAAWHREQVSKNYGRIIAS